MDFKIDTRKRVKINLNKLFELKKETNHDYLYQFLKEFCDNTGLRSTSSRWSKSKRNHIYYFQILDKKKYMLGKIMYGI